MASTLSRTRARFLELRPGREDLVDAGAVLGLLVLALLGFHATYSGWSFLLVGVIGSLLGIAIGHLAVVLRQPAIAVAAMAVGAFFLLGGAVALRHDAFLGVLPSAGALRGLTDQSVHGWKDLLTTLPPVDGTGPLLVLPYLLGLIAGAGGYTMARRVRAPHAALVAPTLLLSAVILLGSEQATTRLAQGAGFASAAVLYLVHRAGRRRQTATKDGDAGPRRLVAAGLVLTAVAGSALLAGGLPGTAGHRVVLRDYVDPPFDVGQYPSPLAGYRKYTKPDVLRLWDAEIFRVNGLGDGDRHVRIATLDDYDGSVWRASNRVGAAFQRVGSSIPPTTSGKSVQVVVTIGRYADVWVPTVGDTVGIRFDGLAADSHTDAFRYNVATGTGVVPDRLSRGDSYDLTAIVPRTYTPKAGDGPGRRPSLGGDLTAFTKGAIAKWSAGYPASDPVARLRAVATWMKKNGAYTDGEGKFQTFLPGHNFMRLATFSNDAQPAGDDEQYAAQLALIANELGLDARVVLGAVPEASGVVMGKDIHAWVEVAISGHGWVPIYSDAFVPPLSQQPDPPLPPKATKNATTIVPPPVGGRPPSSPLTADEVDVRSHPPVKSKGGVSFHLPVIVVKLAKVVGLPLVVVLEVCGLIVFVKHRRRLRRRSIGPPHQRLARGWHDILDYVRDLGDDVPAGTRRQQAEALAHHALHPLAVEADGFVFGPAVVTDAHAAHFWARVDEVHDAMRSRLTRLRRVRAAISLRSLLPVVRT
jgi:hypothetical protein